MDPRRKWLSVLALLFAALMVFAACTPSASPTAAPTNAAPAVSPSAAPKTGASTPASQPASSPTTAAAAAPTGAPIKIGFIAPLSGPMATYGWAVDIPAKLAESDINAAGGINGSPIQLVIEDSPFDPKQAVTSMRKLAEQDNVFAILGPYSSGEFQAAAPLANDLKVVTASNAMQSGIAAANRPWSFQMNVQESVIGAPAIEALKKLHPGIKNVALVADTKDAVSDYVYQNVYPKLIKDAGLNISGNVEFTTDTTDFSAIVTKIKDLNADAIVLNAEMPATISIAKELQRQQVNLPVMTASMSIGGPIAEQAGDAVNGWIMPSYIDWQSPDPKVQSFVQRYFQQANAEPKITVKPHHLVIENLYYDTLQIYADIMRQAGIKADTPLQDARQKILDGMVNLKGWKGISGEYTMLPTGDVSRSPAPPFMTQNGQYQIIR